MAAKAEVSVVLAEVAAVLGAAEKVAAAGEVVVAGTAVVLAARAECSAVVTAGMPRSRQRQGGRGLRGRTRRPPEAANRN